MQSIKKTENLYIGALSGTSMDSIDVSLLKITKKIKIINTVSLKMPQDLFILMSKLSKTKSNLLLKPTKELKKADEKFTLLTVKAIKKLLKKNNVKKNEIKAIGSHGQTIQHFPFSKKPYSLQIGNPEIIAKLTGITTVGNFRQTNIANGGTGAPLTPSFHEAFFRDDKKNRAILNIGGISNVTLLLRNKRSIGWDTGPGNCLIDQSIRTFTNQKKLFDKYGNYGKKGDFTKLNKTIYRILNKSYFSQDLPKSDSTESYDFSSLYFEDKSITKFDWISAMTEITAITIMESLIQNCPVKKLNIYLCGGGSKNNYLIERLKNKLPKNWSIGTTNTLGIDPMLIETSTFGWLAKQRLENKKVDLKASTGADLALTGEIFSY